MERRLKAVVISSCGPALEKPEEPSDSFLIAISTLADVLICNLKGPLL